MKIMSAIVLVASLGHAQTLGDMSKPLPWRMAHQYHSTNDAQSTWTGQEAHEISRLVDLVESGGRGLISLKPELRTDALQMLIDARQNNISSAQGKEMAARLVWGTACVAWQSLTAANGDYLDGEDLVAMAGLIGAPIASRWGVTKREFSLSLERWHRERQ